MKTDLHSVVKRELDQHERLDYEVTDADTSGNVISIWSKAEELGRYVEIIRRNISDTVKEYSVVYNGRTLIQTNDEEKAVEKAILAAEELAQTKGTRTPIIDLMRSAFLINTLTTIMMILRLRKSNRHMSSNPIWMSTLMW